MNVFIINTPYHLLLSSQMKNYGDEIIVINDFNYDDSKFSSLLIESLFGKDRITIINGLRSYRKKVYKLKYALARDKNRIKDVFRNKTINNIILFNDVYPMTQSIVSYLKYKGDVIVVEEGVGLYRDTIKRFNLLYTILGKCLFGSGYKNINRIGEHPKTTVILSNYPNYLNEVQKNKIFERLPSLDFSEISKSLGVKKISDANWFVAQPIVEDGILDLKTYLNLMELAIALIQRDGKRIIIKPHPREDILKYKYLEDNYFVSVCEDKDIPIELLVDSDEEIDVFSPGSSALLNISKLPNVQGYMIYDLFNVYSDLPVELIKSMNIRILKNWHDLESIYPDINKGGYHERKSFK